MDTGTEPVLACLGPAGNYMQEKIRRGADHSTALTLQVTCHKIGGRSVTSTLHVSLMTPFQ